MTQTICVTGNTRKIEVSKPTVGDKGGCRDQDWQEPDDTEAEHQEGCEDDDGPLHHCTVVGCSSSDSDRGEDCCETCEPPALGSGGYTKQEHHATMTVKMSGMSVQ